MLGRLAKWLRLMGYDTFYATRISDPQLVSLAQRESRILLTRDTGILERRVVRDGLVRTVFIGDDGIHEQLRQIVRDLGLSPLGEVRCVECNRPVQRIGKEAVKGSVPPYVFRTQDKFGKCPRCGRIYWQGTHWDRIREKIEAILKEAS